MFKENDTFINCIQQYILPLQFYILLCSDDAFVFCIFSCIFAKTEFSNSLKLHILKYPKATHFTGNIGFAASIQQTVLLSNLFGKHFLISTTQSNIYYSISNRTETSSSHAIKLYLKITLQYDEHLWWLAFQSLYSICAYSNCSHV